MDVHRFQRRQHGLHRRPARAELFPFLGFPFGPGFVREVRQCVQPRAPDFGFTIGDLRFHLTLNPSPQRGDGRGIVRVLGVASGDVDDTVNTEAQPLGQLKLMPGSVGAGILNQNFFHDH